MPETLIRRYAGVTVPRYTSYPTAAEFTPAIGPAEHALWLSRLDPHEPVSLYLHVPYCRALCHYCGCHAKMAIRDEVIANYRRVLETEIRLVGRHLPARLKVARLHWGGGTPSILETEGLASVLEALDEHVSLQDGFEHAIELDPRSVTPALARQLAGLGITRASLGVQDLDAEVQRAIGRLQPLETVADAAAALRGAGIRAINVDLIYGLPHQSVGSVVETARQVAELGPDRIAAYGYAHLPDRRRNQRLIEASALPDAAARFAQARAGADVFREAGYIAVGIDHFARPHDALAVASAEGRLRRNFQGYTDDPCQTLIGFGASAISHLREGFAQSVADNTAYAQAVSSGRLPTSRGHHLSTRDRRRGAIIERLMVGQGVDLGSMGRQDEFTDEMARLRPLIGDGLATLDGSFVAVTDRGRPFVRLVAAVFDDHRRPEPERFSAAV